MKILLLGANGQLGQAFQAIGKNPKFPIGWSVLAWGHQAGDLSKPEALLEAIAQVQPDAIINAAAYTQVDLAESPAEREVCWTINATAPGMLAHYARSAEIPLVHFSSDYVYAGRGDDPHLETDEIAPLNYYGLSKAEGDAAIVKSGADYLIFRTSWVFSHVGKNFVKTMRKLAETKKSLNVVNDQKGSPTYAEDLAHYSMDAFMRALEMKSESRFPSGVYHLTNQTWTNWASFAEAIVPNVIINGIPTSAYPTPAKRPLNSKLSGVKFQNTFGLTPPTWQDALARCLKELDKGNHA